MQNLINKEFLAKILEDEDPKYQGRYKVYIPELMPHLDENVGIWVKNQIHSYRVTPSEKGIYGQYFPLQVGTYVIVKFYENDLNTGYISRIISDHEINSLPFKITDRDDYYQIIRTPKYDNVIAINEDTKDQPANSIHIYFNKDRTNIIIDEQGIHIYTQDNCDIEIDKDEHHHVHQNRYRTVDQNEEILIKQNRKLEVDQNEDIYVKGNRKRTTEGNEDILVKGNRSLQVDGNRNEKINGKYGITISGKYSIKVSGNIELSSSGNLKIYSSGPCNIDAGGPCTLRSGASVQIQAPSIGLNGSAPSTGPASGGSGNSGGSTNEGAKVPKKEEKKEKSTTDVVSKIVFDEYDYFKG